MSTFPEGGSAGGESEPSCGPGPDKGLPFSKKNLLRSVGQCALLRYCEFEERAEALAARAESPVDNADAAGLAATRTAYQDALVSWARAELFQFGPAGSTMEDPVGGRGLRDLIYPWPFVSRCRVEEQVLGKAYAGAGFDDLVQVPVNARGLFAVEYLAFYEGIDNDCTQFSIVNAGDAWNQTPEEELGNFKRQYLSAVAKDVAHRANLLVSAWSRDQGNYLEKLTEADGYMGQQQALNLVAHSLLYAEVEVKDYKVGVPAGLYQQVQLERPEASFSGGATALLRANLLGFEDLFGGCGGEGLGFDDWLIAAGHEDLATDMLKALKGAQQAAEDFPELSLASPEQLLEIHTAIKALTALLKNDFFGQGSPLGLSLPSAVEGDTD